MRKVFVLINNSGIGGTERRLGRLFLDRIAQDHSARLYLNASLAVRLADAGILNPCWSNLRILPGPWSRLATWVQRFSERAAFWCRKIDYVWYAVFLAVRYAAASPCLFHLALGGVYVALPLILTRRSHATVVSITDPNLTHLVGSPLGMLLYRCALERCTRIDALTEGILQDLLRRGIEPQKIAVSPGSLLDVDRFTPVDEKPPWVVFAGRLIQEKNPLLFVRAIPLIKAACPEARFFILGEGPLRQQVEDQIARLAIKDVVTVAFQADIASVLARAQVFVSLQSKDNYPSQSLLEAMACEAGVVATDVGLTWKLVDTETGIRVKPEEADVATAVITFLKNPDRRREAGKKARLLVRTQHSQQGYWRYLEELHRQAIAECETLRAGSQVL